ncbi:MAG TPA: HAD-IA family hydrolase [Gemmatimonadaceae bacterium]|nr:HAD-IA family hydrolase [Gemmatimonadaceae bacterium]
MPANSRPARVRPTILFDLDGTLLDSIELILKSARFAFEKLDRIGPSDEEWLAGVGIPLMTMLRRYASDEADGLALLAAYREYQMANHDRLTRCYDDVVDTVKMLSDRGHDLGVVTSKSEALALRGLAHVGLARYMDTIVGCDCCTRHKPDPEPVRIALHRLDCLPEHALFVGDSVFDVLAGNAAGVETAAALWGAASRAELEPGRPNSYLERMSELPALVDQWVAGLPTA